MSIEENLNTGEGIENLDERFFREVFDGILDGISVIDTDFNILHANHAMANWFPGAPNMIGEKCFVAYHALDKHCDTCPSARSIKSGVIETNIAPFINPEGTKKGWMEVFACPIKNERGEVVRVVEHVRDITEQKNAEDALAIRVGHAEFSAEIAGIFSTGGDLQSVLQKCTELIVKHSDAAFARIWQLDKKQNLLLLRASAGIYTHIDGGHSKIAVGELKIGKIAKDRKPHLTNKVIGDPNVNDQEWAKKEGMVAFAGYPLVVENRLVGVVAVFSSKTMPETIISSLESVSTQIATGIDRKQAEEEAISAKEEAEMANRAKSVFLDSISHEIRTPLTAVIGFSQILTKDATNPLTDQQKKLLVKVIESGDHLLGLVDNLLDFSAIESGRLKVSIRNVSVKLIASTAVVTVENILKEHKVNLVWQDSPEDFFVKADATRLVQVIVNLLTNAAIYCGDKCKVTLDWELLDKNSVRINVSDNGPGIDPKHFDVLFSSFDRLGMESMNKKGVGIGLPIVKRLVEAMGGKIGVESKIGFGSQFFVDLPRGEKVE